MGEIKVTCWLSYKLTKIIDHPQILTEICCLGQ